MEKAVEREGSALVMKEAVNVDPQREEPLGTCVQTLQI